MSVQKYQFRLSKLNSKQLQLEQALFALFGTEQLMQSVQTSCEQHLHLRPHFHLESWRSETASEIVSKLADTSIVLSILPQTRQCPFLIEFDVATARQFIEHTLGGREVAEVSGSPLTDIEQGVLQYLILHLLADLQDASHKQFQLQRMMTHGRDISSILKDNDTLLALTFRLHERSSNHFIRCLFPHRLLTEELAQQKIPPFSAVLSATDLQHYPFVETELWAEAGETTLSFEELQQLEVGDVLLFDETFVGFHASQPQGEVVLRVGTGKHAAIQGKLVETAGGKIKVLLEHQVGEKI